MNLAPSESRIPPNKLAAMRHACLVLVCFVACMAALTTADDLPVFENEGGPPFLDSVIYGYSSQPGDEIPEGDIDRAGVISGGRFTYAKYFPEGPLTQMGLYDSWECVDPENQPGAYRAIAHVQFVQPDQETRLLMAVQKVVCEIGRVDPSQSVQYWAWSEDPHNCPNTTERINYRDWTRPGLNYSCGVPEAEPLTGFTGDEVAAAEQAEESALEFQEELEEEMQEEDSELEAQEELGGEMEEQMNEPEGQTEG